MRDVIDRLGGLGSPGARLRQTMQHALGRHQAWIRAHGDDLPEVQDWRWGG